jgi:glycosyltransferase involved in cell wall biosynthesis
MDIHSWRHVGHSYGLVCQNIVLEFIYRNNISNKAVLYFVDTEYGFQRVKGMFTPEDTQLIDTLAPPPADIVPDFVLRFSYPIDISYPVYNNTLDTYKTPIIFVFATVEREATSRLLLNNSHSWNSIPSNMIIMPPSNWSANIMIDYGGTSREQIFLLPHGYDPRYYYKAKTSEKRKQCQRWRKSLGIAPELFIFLNVGAGTGNKNIAVLLTAFARIHKKYPNKTMLLLKMTSTLYGLEQKLLDYAKTLDIPESNFIWYITFFLLL